MSDTWKELRLIRHEMVISNLSPPISTFSMCHASHGNFTVHLKCRFSLNFNGMESTETAVGEISMLTSLFPLRPPSSTCRPQELDPISYSSEDLKLFTEDFSEKNFLGNTQYGKLYRGKIPNALNHTEAKEVTVKIWADHAIYRRRSSITKESRLKDEIYFLQHPSVNDHPNLVKLIGYCQNSKPLGVVYDLNPIDTLHNLIAKDTFTWLQRIKVALGFARLLDFLHDREYMLRNIDAAHIMIDQDFNPRLFEFGSFSGGILGDKIKTDPFNGGTVGYLDHHSLLIVEWSVPCDIYTYGVVLLSLVAKRVVNKKKPEGTWVDLWAKKKYSARVDKEKRKNIWLRCLGKEELMQVEFSLVHPSLQKDLAYDACDGHKITRLAMNCLENGWLKRPTMKEMVQSLQELHVARSHGDAVGVKPVLDDIQSTETSLPMS